jgi:hypothetical protein
MKQFTAASLEDIADVFDARALECDRQAATCARVKHADHYRAQAGVWSTAAEILRSTVIAADPQATPANPAPTGPDPA